MKVSFQIVRHDVEIGGRLCIAILWLTMYWICCRFPLSKYMMVFLIYEPSIFGIKSLQLLLGHSSDIILIDIFCSNKIWSGILADVPPQPQRLFLIVFILRAFRIFLELSGCFVIRQNENLLFSAMETNFLQYIFWLWSLFLLEVAHVTEQTTIRHITQSVIQKTVRHAYY